jgi:predicted porin
VKKTFISAAAILAFATAAHADELTDIQAQSKQLRDQNQALTKRLADLEKRQKNLETQTAAKPATLNINPVDAMAADLPYKAAVKARPPESDDLCWHGICLYGNFDMGLVYQPHTSPFNAMAGGPLNYMVEKASNGSYFGVGANMMSTSFIGLRGKQEIADNLYAVFNLQTLFNPASGMSANGIGAIAQNNGLGAPGSLQFANSYGDSSKAGALFNNVAYFGISSPTYGTFTMGRQSALSSDLVVNYDALSGSNAWSAITFEGATGGGGVTENRIYDNSYEYRVNVGPMRFAAEAQLMNGGNSSTGNAFEGDIGFDYSGLSMDFVGGKIYDANSVGTTLSAAQVGAITAANIGCSLGCLAGVISDNTFFSVAGKYVIGAWKFYGGYERIQYQNPDNPLLPQAFNQGGYNIAFVNNGFYQTDRIMNIFWAGVKYSVTPTLDIMGAYYGYRQNNFLQSGQPGTSLVNPAIGGGYGAINPANVGCTSSAFAGCSGSMDMVSLAMDWRFARHMDLYAGVSYSQKQGGLANGYVLTATNASNAATFNTFNKVSTWDPGIGLRYQF